MQAAAVPVERLGRASAGAVFASLPFWKRRNPDALRQLQRAIFLRRWRSLETAAENWWAFLCGLHLARRFREEQVEHIHAPWAAGPATAAWVASGLTGIPFSFAAHAADIYPPDGALAEKIRDCAFVRAESVAGIEHLKRFAGDQHAKLHMIHNGQVLQGVAESAVPMQPPCRLLALGRFVQKKGFDTLLHACHVLDSEGFDFRLELGGSGPEERRLKSLARRLGLGGRVSFPGFVRHDRVSDFCLHGDLLVAPSRVADSGDRDGIPNVILEALLHRLPVVASAVGGIPEVIADKQTGLLVPPGHPEALARALVAMTGDRASALRMAGNGRNLVMRDFDLEDTSRRLIELFCRHAMNPAQDAK